MLLHRRQSSTNLRTRVSLLLSVAALAGCAHQIVDDLSEESVRYSTSGAVMQTKVSSCRDSLNSPAFANAGALDPDDIRVFNWNIQKNRAHNWRDDFTAHIEESDLVLLQEISLRHDSATELMASKHLSFTPGYRKTGEVTGVMTISSVAPMTQCSFINLEPVIKTPKTTNITQFALTSTDETLVVVNLHAVNFSLGLGAFRQQFEQIYDVLSEHSGPIILSGDFNTWRQRRIEIVDELTEALNMVPVEFAEDFRKRAFGNALDHIYVRGLSAVESVTRSVETSDHNPMSVILSR